ncbi:MAG: hypothetical protein JMDDDDMK_05071 [Acidobacteria bacterium]|nr:hypothetical protein [Acidobacteriota bacterium]
MAVPFKTNCLVSRAIPAASSGSLTEPALTLTLTATSGDEWRSRTITVNPFLNTYREIAPSTSCRVNLPPSGMPSTVVNGVLGFGVGFGAGTGCRPRPLCAGAIIEIAKIKENSAMIETVVFPLRYIFFPSSLMKCDSDFSTNKTNYNLVLP